MKRTNLIAVVILAGAAFAVGRWAQPLESSALAQPEKKPPAKQPDKPAKPADPAQPSGLDPKMQEMMTKATTVGENHKLLDSMAGSWEGSVKIWMEPGSEPMEFKGTVNREWQLNGRFLFEHVEANSDMGPFHGIGITGYNTVEGHYESVWLEDQATYMSHATGKYDAAKKTFIFEGDVLDPTSGKKSKHRDMVDVSNPTRHTMVGYATGPDGKEFKSFEGVFEKKP